MCNQRAKVSFFFAGLLILVVATLAMTATLEVDDSGGTPYQTIQSAIDAAVPGQDDVFVRCGTYNENITMRDQVSVIGEGADCTVIDGGQNGPVVWMVGIGAGTVLEGFRIRNGRSGFAGGIYIEAGSPTITKNVITGNSAVVTEALTGYGGGIHITSSVAAAGWSEPAPIITSNVIRNNTAEKFGGGIEVYYDDGSTITNNVIVDNRALEGGGGIDMYLAYSTVANNTIVRNCLQGTGTACDQGGGGIAITESGVVHIANNVIAWNEAATGGGGVDVQKSTVDFESNDTFDNQPRDYSGTPDPTGSDGNISTDPLLVDERDDSFISYQPRSDSPLVDAGGAAHAPADDLRGVGRPLDGDASGTGEPDIGARENEGITRLGFGVGTSSVSWDPSIDPSALHNLYRGDLQTLRDTGVYTQDPGAAAGARRWCDQPSPSVSDLDEPDPGQTFFYLAVVNGTVEGTLGFDSGPSQRPYTEPNRCP